MNICRNLLACALVLPALNCLADSTSVHDYGIGHYASAADWQRGGASAADVPMDYGIGAFASIAQWQQAGGATPTAVAAR